MFKTYVQNFVNDRMIEMPNTINSMMEFHLVECNEATQELVLSFPVEDWQINPLHTMHGGMIATAFDITMGCLSYASNGGNPNPTIEMQIRFLKGIPCGEVLYIYAKALHVGKRMVQVEAHAFNQDKSIRFAQASASYMINPKK